MTDKNKGNGNKGTFVTDGASVPTKLIKKGATVPVKPKPKPADK
ncbi:MAG: hypothetical protein AB9Q19_13935 [Candidatus Reddybacter sp.]